MVVMDGSSVREKGYLRCRKLAAMAMYECNVKIRKRYGNDLLTEVVGKLPFNF